MHPFRLVVRALGAVALTALIATSLPNAVTGARAATPMANAPAIDTSNLDPTCKPCDDFYQFATGGWSKRTTLPTGHARWGGFDELAERNRDELHTILEAAAKVTNAPAGSDTQKLGAFYRACMDTDAIEKAGTTPLAPLLRRHQRGARRAVARDGDRDAAARRRGRGRTVRRPARHQRLLEANRRARVRRLGPARPRLLFQRRRARRDDPYRVQDVRHDAVPEPRRRRSQSGHRSRRRHRARDRARESDAQARRPARSVQALQPHAGREAAGARAAPRLEVVLRGIRPAGVHHGERLGTVISDGVRRTARDHTGRHVEDVPALPRRGLVRGLAAQAFRRGEPRVPQRRAARDEGTAPALAALHRRDRRRAARRARQGIRRRGVPAGGEDARARARRQPPGRAARRHRHARVDERAHEDARPRKARGVHQEDRLPRQVGRLLGLASRQRPVRERRPDRARSGTTRARSRASARRRTARAGA